MISPKVSVHIVTYNSSRTLSTCLDSLRNQTFTDYHVVVVDNASTDQTLDYLGNSDLHLIRNGKNCGYAAAHNQALQVNNSCYILTLNPDVWLAPDFIAQMVKTMEEQPQLGSAAAKLLRVDNLEELPAQIDSTGLFMRRNRHQGLRFDGELVNMPTADISAPIFGPDGAAAFYRREMLEDIAIDKEVFDEDFFMHKEDIDICWRAQLKGWKSLYVPAACAHHIRTFRPGHRDRVPPAVRFYAIRNRYLLALKNEIPSHFFQDSWAILPYDLGILIYLLLKERNSLKAISSAWALRKKMLSKRKAVQSTRQVSRKELSHWFT